MQTAVQTLGKNCFETLLHKECMPGEGAGNLVERGCGAAGPSIEAGATEHGSPAETTTRATYPPKLFAPANGQFLRGNGSFAHANGSLPRANGSLALANGLLPRVNDSFARANDKLGCANGLFTRANDAAASANDVERRKNEEFEECGEKLWSGAKPNNLGCRLIVAPRQFRWGLKESSHGERIHSITRC
jgi:hypothetical protein